MRYKDSFCNGCETCRNCGRDKEITFYECDKCGDVGYSEDYLTEHEGKELCRFCLEEVEENDI